MAAGAFALLLLLVVPVLIYMTALRLGLWANQRRAAEQQNDPERYVATPHGPVPLGTQRDARPPFVGQTDAELQTIARAQAAVHGPADAGAEAAGSKEALPQYTARAGAGADPREFLPPAYDGGAEVSEHAGLPEAVPSHRGGATSPGPGPRPQPPPAAMRRAAQIGRRAEYSLYAAGMERMM